MRSSKITSASLAILFISSLALGACSSSSETATKVTTTTKKVASPGDGSEVVVDGPTTTTLPRNATYRIGLEGPLTGDQRETGIGMLRGARMAAKELNANGGVLGKQVVIVPIDDKADPVAGVAAANAAIASGLDGVVGPYNSGAGLQTLPLYIAAGLVPIRLTSSDQTAGLGFTLQPMTSQIAPVAAETVTGWLGAKSVGIIFDSTQAYTLDAAVAMKALFTAAGVKITSYTPIKPGKKNYSAVVAKVARTKPDVIYVDTYYPEGGLIAKEMFKTKVKAQCLADFGAYDNGFIPAAGVKAAKKCPVLGVPAPSDFPGAGSLIATYRKLYKAAPGAWTPYAYDSLNVLAAAASVAGGFEAKGLTTALNGTKRFSGWTGRVAFEASTGNRIPAPITVDLANSRGEFHIDRDWAKFTNFGE